MAKDSLPPGWGFGNADVLPSPAQDGESLLDWLLWLYQGINPDLMAEADGSPNAAARLAGDLADRLMREDSTRIEQQIAAAMLMAVSRANPGTLVDLFGLATGHRRPEHWRQEAIAQDVDLLLKQPGKRTTQARAEVAEKWGLSPSRVKAIHLHRRSVDSMIRRIMAGSPDAETAYRQLGELLRD